MQKEIITKPYPDVTLVRRENGRGHWYEANGKKVLFSPSGIANIVDKPNLKYWYANCMAEELAERLNTGQSITVADIEGAKRAWERKIAREADFGTQVHSYAESFVRGETPQLPEHPKARNGALAWNKWFDEYHIEPLETESHVYSKKYKFAGTTDLLAKVNGKIAILDYKCSSPKNPLPVCCLTIANNLKVSPYDRSKQSIEKRDDGYTCKHCGQDCMVASQGIYSNFCYQTVMYQMAREEMRPADGRRSFEPGEIEERWVIRFDKLTGQFEAHKLDDRKKDEEAVKALLKIAKREKELT